MKPKGQRPAREASDRRLWARVAATVRPLPGRPAPSVPPPPAAMTAAVSRTKRPIPPPTTNAPAPQPPAPPRPHDVEPGRRRRVITGRDAIEGRIDLHGMTHDEARAALTGFVQRAHAEGRRVLLVITGKGSAGSGILRRRTPEWLAEAPLRGLVAGVGEAHRRHGGGGALYVTLKRARRP